MSHSDAPMSAEKLQALWQEMFRGLPELQRPIANAWLSSLGDLSKAASFDPNTKPVSSPTQFTEAVTLWQRQLQQIQTQAEALFKQRTPVAELFQDAYAEWAQCFDETYLQQAQSADFARAYGQLLNSWLASLPDKDS